MFTVILPDSRLAGTLENCRLLFEPYLLAGELAFCPWGEEGRTEDAFLSALTALTAGKSRWQALVLTDSALPFAENPFDFEAAGRPYSPSENALVRLTHLLSQKPRDIAEDDDGAGSPLAPKDRPARLLLLSTRYLPDYAEEQKLEGRLSRMARPRLPSQFWQRNGYAWQSRFLVCDVEYRRGQIPPADCFRFWLTVLAVALSGEEEQAALHAFCLYRAAVSLDGPLLVRTLSRKCAEFSYLHKALLTRQNAARHKPPAGELPVLSIPVQLVREEIPPETLSVDPAGLGLFSDSRRGGADFWPHASRLAADALKKIRSLPRRTLDEAAARTKERMNPDPGQSLVLDEGQRRDLLEQTLAHEEEMNRACVDQQKRISRLFSSLDAQREEVRRLADGRMTRRSAAVMVLIAALALLLGMLPAIVSAIREESGGLPVLFLTTFAGILMAILAGGAALFLLRRPIRAAIRRFNATADAALAAIEEKNQQIAHYLTETCAAARGWSYLNRLGRRTEAEEQNDLLLRRHLYALRETASLYADWALYFGDSVEAHLEPVPFVPFEPSVLPEENPAYWLPTPYRFLNGIQFSPEEVIEDARD